MYVAFKNWTNPARADTGFEHSGRSLIMHYKQDIWTVLMKPRYKNEITWLVRTSYRATGKEQSNKPMQFVLI